MSTLDVKEALNVVRVEQSSRGCKTQRELSDAIESLVQITSDTYSRESIAYADARTSQPWNEDSRMTNLMLDAVRSRIRSGELSVDSAGKWRLLDVGAGYGRDVLRFAKESDIVPVALENAPGFVSVLRHLQDVGELGPGCVVEADMRNMIGVASASFECVRNHATLHHLPVIAENLGADQAVSECRRALKCGGIFHILVKAGNGVDLIDTKEGLGGRFFQLFSIPLLSELVQRHQFKLIHVEELLEPRGSSEIPWIFALAVAI